MDRASAVKALAEDLGEYMEDLIHKKQVAGNASNSAQQHTMGTPAAVQAASQGADRFIPPHHAAGGATGQGTTHRTASTGQRTRPGKPHSRPKNSGGNSNWRENNPGANRSLDSRGRPTRAHPPTSHRARSRGDTRVHSGVSGHRHLVAIWKTTAGSGRTQPNRHTLQPKEETNVFLTGQHAANISAAASTQGTETSASTRPPTKRLRQATLTGKPAPAARQAREIFNTPTQPSAWFTANYTGVHTESGIARWFGGLKIPDKKKNEVRQHIETVMRQFPSISEEQRSNLDRHGVAQGIAVRAVAKFADAPLMRLLSIITAMSE